MTPDSSAEWVGPAFFVVGGKVLIQHLSYFPPI
jgi:hypothetical protein